jgi:hypothetical protein
MTEDYNAMFANGEGDKDWLVKTDEEHWLVKTRMGIFKIKELEWDKMERARKRAGDKGEPMIFVLSDSIVGKDGEQASFGEVEIRKWKGSTVLRLVAAMNFIYEVDDFLQQ